MKKQLQQTIVRYKDYVAGWVDSSIHAFFELLPPTLDGMNYALLTSLDSTIDFNTLPPNVLGRFGSSARILDKGLLVPVADLLEADLKNQLFFGFDEVWFFPTDKVKPKPDQGWLVGPHRATQEVLDMVGPWMSRNNCVLGLGDGCGLNFVVNATGVLAYVLGCSLSQPDPVDKGEIETQSPAASA